MNRIEEATKFGQEEGTIVPRLQIESALFTPSAQDSSRALFVPLHYEARYAYPLLVWLHGPGDDKEGQLARIMPQVSMRNYVAVAPRGFSLDDSDSARSEIGWPQTEEGILEAQHRVFESMEAVRRKFNISKQRVFLAGSDAGGTMAFRVAMNYPDRFAGVLSICGAFPVGHHPFGHLNRVRRLSVFLAIGRDSREYSPAMACENLRLFHTAGMSIALRQYPCGHQLTLQMLADVDRWIMEQITASQDRHEEPDNRWSCSSE